MQVMECVNVFVKYSTNTFGLLLPIGCRYVELVGMICQEISVDSRTSCLRISYDVGGDMAPVRITNDNSLLFYVELKRKEPILTTYPLCVVVDYVHMETPCEPDRCVDFLISSEGSAQNDAAPIMEMNMCSESLPTMNEFAATVDINEMQIHGDDSEVEFDVITETCIDNVAEKQIYRDKKILKDTVALYAIKNNFEFVVYKSDSRKYVLVCKADGCNWRLRASAIGQTNMFKVRYIRNGHTCAMECVIRDHVQAKSALIGDFIKHKYTSARTIYTPVDIMKDMSSSYGLTLKYGKAWRAREYALEEIMGDPNKAYGRLPLYFKEIEKKNPGSKTSIEVDSEGHFKYAFMSLGASIEGWKHCKPVVVIDATFLTGRFGGSLLTACTQDANNSIFILAFGIGDSENNDSWGWFLRRFKDAYGVRDDMCFVSDRHPSIEHAVHEVYPGVLHGFCARHILQNLRTSYGNCSRDIARPFNAAARAYTTHEFEYHMKQLDQIKLGIRGDLDVLTCYHMTQEVIGFHKWARSYSPTNRYSAMTSNIVESVNAVTKSVKHCPIDYMFESLRHIIQSWFSKNRALAQGTFTRLTSKAKILLRANAKKSLKMKVSTSNEYMYQVSDAKSAHVVDLNVMTCTCNKFQLDGLPCKHALAVIGDRRDQPYNYCSRYHTKECYLASYAGYVTPLGDSSQWIVEKSRRCYEIMPPNSKRAPSRLKKTRRRSRVEGSQQTICGRCAERGHNRRTCKQPQPLCHMGKRKRGSATEN